MKIAVLSTIGEQTDQDNILKYYHAVPNNYNFLENMKIDVTNVKVLNLFSYNNRFDYKVYRSSLATYANSFGFDNLNYDDKHEVAKQFAIGMSGILSIFPLTNDRILNGYGFHSNSIECRRSRWRMAVSECYNRLPKSQTNEIISDLGRFTQADISVAYVDLGYEGTESGDNEGLFDYVLATSGTSFQNSGLITKNWTPAEMTMPALCYKIINILKGNIIPD